MKSFNELAADLAKPGAEIVAEMTPMKAHLMHMAVGIAGEAAELLEAVSNGDQEHIIEEIGDLRFYIAGLRNGMGWEDGEPVAQHAGNEDQCAQMIVFASGIVLDVVKKWWAYDKPLSNVDLLFSLNCLMVWVSSLQSSLGIRTEQVLAENNAKLSKRYATGSYSNQQAQERADKEEVNA